MSETIDADVFTPAAAATSLRAVASAYKALLVSIEQHRANQVAMGIGDELVAFLDAMKEAATTVVAAAERAAERAQQQVQTVQNTLGNARNLAGVVAGTPVDPTLAV